MTMSARGPDRARLLFVLYLGLLVWAPVPLGSNRAWSAALLAVVALLLTTAWLASVGLGRAPLGHTVARARAAIACAALWLVVVGVQLVPLPLTVLEWLSPAAAHWYRTAASADATAFAPLSLDRFATWEATCRSAAYVGFFVLGLALLDSRRRILIACITLVSSGVLQAWIGAVEALQQPGAPATGTFVNRNHFAGYLVLCLSVGIGLLIGTLSGERHMKWRHFFRALIEWIVSPKMALRLGLLVMVVALVVTRSRMGNSAFFMSLLVTGSVGLALSRHATRSMVVVIASLMAVDLLVVGTYFGAREVVERIAQTDVAAEDRDDVTGYALAIWRDHWLFGTGLGAFPAVFARYSGPVTEGAYTHAHNDYVEFLAETGMLGIAALGALVLLSTWTALRAHAERRDPLMRGLSFASLMGIIALMIHSAVDFNLQIPANALTFMFVLSLAWISRHHHEPARTGHGTQRPGNSARAVDGHARSGQASAGVGVSGRAARVR